MQEVSFTVETVTPLFLAGADQEAPELRAPSFRGVLRYWLRALLGGCLIANGSPALPDIVRQEAEVFGTTDAGSAVILRLQSEVFAEARLVRREAAHNAPPTGQDYLFWSLIMQGQRKYLPSEGTFTLTLSIRNHADPQELLRRETALQQAVAAFWLLANLGGLGSRSRRGAGSLAVVGTQGWAGPISFQVSNSAEGVQTALRDGLIAARSLCQQAHPLPALQQAPFDVLEPHLCRIWVLQDAAPWASAKDALEAIGKRMSEFRHENPLDYPKVAQWLSGEPIQTVERAIFGLPLPFRYSSGLTGVVQGANHDRRASPLLLRVAKLSGASRYVGVAVLFKSQFLRPGEQLKSRNRQTGKAVYASPPTQAGPGYGLIEQWVQQKFPHALEVRGW